MAHHFIWQVLSNQRSREGSARRRERGGAGSADAIVEAVFDTAKLADAQRALGAGVECAGLQRIVSFIIGLGSE
jgi:hypothetical protein